MERWVMITLLSFTLGHRYDLFQNTRVNILFSWVCSAWRRSLSRRHVSVELTSGLPPQKLTSLSQACTLRRDGKAKAKCHIWNKPINHCGCPICSALSPATPDSCSCSRWICPHSVPQSVPTSPLPGSQWPLDWPTNLITSVCVVELMGARG